MPFWLHESRTTHILRHLSAKTQILIGLCTIFSVTALSIFFKYYLPPSRPLLPKPLQKGVVHGDSRQMQPVIKNALSISIDLQTIPQTLSFFTVGGLHVCKVERIARGRRGAALGYVISVQGSFEALLKFLHSLKGISSSRLRLQSIERISDSKLEIQFFMQVGKG